MSNSNKIDEIERYVSESARKLPFDISWYIYSRLKKEKGIEKSVLPLKIGLKITDSCNFNCSYCFTKKSKNNMSYKTVSNFINSLKQKPYSVYLTGGEPFLNPDVFKIINLLHTNNIIVSVHTTGILNNEILKKLGNEISKIARLQVSIDSIKLFSNLRPSKEDYPIKKITQFIKIIENRKKVHINCVLSQLNKNCIEDIIDFCSENDIQFLRLSTIFTEDDDLKLYDDDMIGDYYRFVSVAKRSGINIIASPFCHPWSLKTKHKKQEHLELFCPAQKTEIEIDSLGNVYPCPFLHDKAHRMGNINEMPFSEIWDGGVLDLNQLSWSSNEKCQACNHFKSCGGGCYANAILQKKDFDPRCIINV